MRNNCVLLYENKKEFKLCFIKFLFHILDFRNKKYFYKVRTDGR